MGLMVLALGGCMFGPSATVQDTLVSGTTTGNIQNLGFAVRDGDELYFYNTAAGTYEVGDIIKSNPETEENSLAFHDGGFYMSIVDGSLYYCKEDGIYRAPMDTFEPELLREGHAQQLQILDGQMFFIEDGVIQSALSDGKAVDFSPIKGAACLNVYENKLYYIDSASGQIWQADTNGSDAKMLFDLKAKQFLILDGVFYYIDSEDKQIKRVSAEKLTPETVVPYACSSLNLNAYGMFYTRQMDGKRVLGYSDTNGENEQVIEGNAPSDMYMVCIFNGGLVIVPAEEFDAATE
jgi:hypothetical protein